MKITFSDEFIVATSQAFRDRLFTMLSTAKLHFNDLDISELFVGITKKGRASVYAHEFHQGGHLLMSFDPSVPVSYFAIGHEFEHVVMALNHSQLEGPEREAATSELAYARSPLFRDEQI